MDDIMKVEELFEGHLYTNNHYSSIECGLTEGFIDETIIPKLRSILEPKVKNANSYKSKYKSAISKAKKRVDSEGIDANVVEKIAKQKVKESNPKEISESIIKTQIKEILDELKKRNKLMTISIALLTLIVVIILNSAMLTILAVHYSPTVVTMITAILFAPVTEEVGKYISIKTETTGAYLIGFNIAEFLIFMSQAAVMGVPLAAMAVFRLIPVVMHTMWTIIMRHDMQSGKAGLPRTMAMHSLYNTLPPVGAAVTVWYYLKSDKKSRENNES